MVSTPKSFNKETISSLVVPYKFPCVIILSPALTFAIIEAAMAAIPDANNIPKYGSSSFSIPKDSSAAILSATKRTVGFPNRE